MQPRLWGYTVSLQKHPYGALAESLFLFYRLRCLLIAAQIGAGVALDALAELVVVAGQDGVQNNARQCGDGQTGQGDVGAAHGEGDAAGGGEAQTAHEDDGGDDEVAGLGEIHLVLHHVAHAHGGDHTVQDEADAAHDGGGDGVDQRVKLGGEAEDDGVQRRQTDNTGIVHAAQCQHAGVLAVGGVGRAAEHTSEGGGKTVAQQGAVQAGILDEVLAGGGGDGGDVADVLHHGGDGDGGHDQNGGDVKLGDDELLQTHEVGTLDGGEVDQGLHDAVSVRQLRAAGGGDECHDVRAHHAQQNGNDLDHALTPDVGDDDDGDSHQSQPPAGGGVGHGGAGQVQADEDDDGAGNDGREEPHDLLGAHQLEQQRQHQIQQTRDHHAAQCVGQLLLAGHGGELAAVQIGYRLEAAQKGEGGAQEGGYLKLGADMEQQRADTGKQQRGLDGQGQTVALHQNGDQHRSAEHGKQVLQAQQEHPGDAQLTGVVDGVVSEFFVHVIVPLFRLWIL